MSADEDFDEDEEFVEGGPTRVAVVFETIFEARAPLRGALSCVAAHASARGRGRVFPPSPLFQTEPHGLGALMEPPDGSSPQRHYSIASLKIL